jgi:hypothetical protein
MSLESDGGMILTGETEELEEKLVPVPLCPPQISHGLTRTRTRASAGSNPLLYGPVLQLMAGLDVRQSVCF